MVGRSSRTGQGRALPIAVAGLLAGAALLFVWWKDVEPPSAPVPAPTSEPRSPLREPPPVAPVNAPVVRAPAQRIADQGRLRVPLEALREGEVLAVGLDLPDELRGAGPQRVRIIDVSGRKLERTALPLEGPGTGLRLELEPGWLRPGLYMIEVETAGGGPLPVRRYVLEVVGAGAAG